MEPLGAKHRSLKEVVADELRRAILAGRFLPGQHLTAEELASQFGVSRMPVREAFSILEAEGFVNLVPRKGASVASLGAQEALELFQVRSVLEGLAARLATQRKDEEALGRLAAIIERGNQLLDEGRVDEVPALHEEFHVVLAEAGGNSYLLDLASTLPAKVTWMYNTQVRSRANVSWPEHGEILEAILSGDEARAEEVTRSHVDQSAEEFIASLEQQDDD